ncbi:cation:dicarboxylase symporter family transporter [Novosphingobium flavum]|uniref:dicarboxylate/amino acid:cation symporter n=1 Tax=Novosphingobium aerophilum TaxID=2839843 RepID=UPI00163B295F|nr:cation:dicarboxylase symporter family transporter [Novosphingobium aerophilum]MBC2661805.1 cation:dicarboxylase symporter family transporter [Novosphingobium aerophilum]
MSRTQWILAALVAGVLAGMGVRWLDQPVLTGIATAAMPIGQMWVRALQMTLIPLIFAMMTHGVAQAVMGGRGGRLISTTLGVFFGIMVVTVILCTVLTETVLRIWPLPAHALDSLLGNAAPQPLPGFAEQLVAIVPDNPVAAAAQGQIFPLVIFALGFGLALARLPRAADGGEPVVLRGLAEVAQAMMILVDWVLVAAPPGIFLLSLGLGMASGVGVAQVLGVFVALCFATTLLMAALCYVVVAVAGGMPLRDFAAAIAPAQAMGAGSCSSMATTPVMIEVALERLRLPEDVVGLVIPMAVSIFRLGTTAHAVAAVLVAAHAVGIEPGPVQLVLAGLAVILGSVSGAGLPGAAVIYAIYGPGLQVLGAPMAMIPLYLAVIALPDPVITGTTVTGDLTAAVLINRLLGRGREPVSRSDGPASSDPT